MNQNDKEAVRGFHEAAEQGNAEAQCSLGCMHEKGRVVKQNETEAVRWYRKAADQGEADAPFSLRIIHGATAGTGSYRGTVWLYDARSGKACLDVTRAPLASSSQAPFVGGVTQLQYSPDGRFLFSGSRKGPSSAEQSHVVCWDPRVGNGAVLASYPRSARTYQRIGFDIDPLGRFLATGSD